MPEPENYFDQVHAATAYVRSLYAQCPSVGIILGSGLGTFAEKVEEATIIPFATIPHFPHVSVEGHFGNLILGLIAGVPVAVMQGRVHAYEGYGMAAVTFPTRLLAMLGCHTLIVTNAAGAIRQDLHPGTLVALSDHINFTGRNAASGPNEARFALDRQSGQRFFDMSAAYSPRLRAIAREEAVRLGQALEEGVYLAVLGPSFETPAEIRAFRTLGADLVGMSTVHEVIVARHMGMEVLGLSLVTNAAAGVTSASIDHRDVMEIGRLAAVRMGALLAAILSAILSATRATS